jgi:multiple sugar transport system permease protein
MMPTLARRRNGRFGRTLLLLAALVLLAPTLFIFYWMFTTALKPIGEIVAYPPSFLPRQLTLAHLQDVLRHQNIPRYALNSLIISGSTTAIGLVFSLPAAYALVRLHRQASWGLAILGTRMLPGLLALIGWYRLFQVLDLLDTYQAIVLTHLIYAVPLMIWILMGYFEDLDPDLESAALVDGCSRFGAFLRVGVPLVGPGVIVATILVFITSWNDFIRGLIFAGPDKRPLTLAVFRAMSLDELRWGEMMAAAVFVLLPVLLITLFLQRYIVAGLASGGVKG